MTEIREIAQLGASVLRQHAQLVTDVHNDETRQIIAAMHATLASTQGVGIAAPQISISKRIIIVASRSTARYPHAAAAARRRSLTPPRLLAATLAWRLLSRLSQMTA